MMLGSSSAQKPADRRSVVAAGRSATLLSAPTNRDREEERTGMKIADITRAPSPISMRMPRSQSLWREFPAGGLGRAGAVIPPAG